MAIRQMKANGEEMRKFKKFAQGYPATWLKLEVVFPGYIQCTLQDTGCCGSQAIFSLRESVLNDNK